MSVCCSLVMCMRKSVVKGKKYLCAVFFCMVRVHSAYGENPSFINGVCIHVCFAWLPVLLLNDYKKSIIWSVNVRKAGTGGCDLFLVLPCRETGWRVLHSWAPPCGSGGSPNGCVYTRSLSSAPFNSVRLTIRKVLHPTVWSRRSCYMCITCSRTKLWNVPGNVFVVAFTLLHCARDFYWIRLRKQSHLFIRQMSPQCFALNNAI